MTAACKLQKRVRLGFTRAELLAVIAGCSLLVGLLVPALSPASQRNRQTSDLAACRENLRQIGTGLLAFAQDHGGSLPQSATLVNPHVDVIQALVPSYVANPKPFYCPAEQRPALSYSEANFHAGIIGYFYYSADAAGPDDNLSRFIITGIDWPRKLKTGMNPQSWVMSDIWFSGDPTAHAGYRKGVNYLMLDGSTGFVAESPRQAFH